MTVRPQATGSSCDGISISPGTSAVGISGLNGAPYVFVTINDAQNNSVFNCYGAACGNRNNIVRPLPGGTYTTIVTYFDANQFPVCSDTRIFDIIGTGADESPVAEVLPASVLEVFPNPTRNFVIIRRGASGPEKVTLRLIDNTGRTVITRQTDGAALRQYRLDLSGLPQGLYYLSLVSAKGDVQARQLVVAR